MCDLAGLATPDSVEGLSLASVLKGQQKTRRTAIFTAYRDVQRAVRDDRWKLIVYPQINRMQLFDLQNDPDELRNLADDAKFAKQLDKMKTLLQQQQKLAGDQLPLTTANPPSAVFVPPSK